MPRGRPAPPPELARRHQLTVRFTDAEWEALLAAKQQRGHATLQAALIEAAFEDEDDEARRG